MSTKYRVVNKLSTSDITYVEKKTLTSSEKKVAGDKPLFTRTREREDIYFTDNYWDEIRKKYGR